MFQLLRKLRGRSVSLEHAAPGRATPELLENVWLWDLFDDNALALLIMVRRAVEPDVTLNGQALPNLQATRPTRVHQFFFKWVATANIVSVTQYAGLSVSESQRKLSREDVPPLYSDGKDGWEVLDEGVKYWIEKRLFEMGWRAQAPTPPAAATPTPAPKVENPVPAATMPVQRVAP